MSEMILKEEERIALALRSLYKKYGYLPYKMSKFEPYDLYVENKQFLVGDGVITFNDTDGRLMALKPDVTLSIVKNDVDEGEKRKVYYDESVYRISAKTKQFKEIKQVGLECIGDIGVYDVYESVCLAAQSLAAISDRYVLDLSHLGVFSATLNALGGGEEFVKKVIRLVSEKNAHEAVRLCKQYGVDEAGEKKLLALINGYGDMQTTLQALAPYCQSAEEKAAYDELAALCALLQKTEYASHIRLDFSVVNDMNYYDDVVFKGFIQGVSEGVLSGGRYDRLLDKMGKKSGAIGFAVYLDLLEGLTKGEEGVDVDVLVVYDEATAVATIAECVNRLVGGGKSVRAQKKAGGLRYRELIDLSGGKL